MQARRVARPAATNLVQQLVAADLAPEARAALTPAAAGVPPRLWARALEAPVTEMLGRPGKEFRGRLTALAYRLAGGRDEPPALLGAMLEIIHAGSMIVDDIEDDSAVRRGRPALHRLYGVPLALNAGNWMYFYPFELVERLGLDPAAELALRRRMSRAMLDCHHGQALDLEARVGEVGQRCVAGVALATSTLKTGRLTALAAASGALVAGGDAAAVEALAAFGEDLGIGLQMLDDLGNLSGEAAAGKRFEDLRHGRITWAWAWAAALLDGRAFGALEETGRAVARGVRPDGLAEQLRALVTAQGRLQVRWSLDRALAHLRAHFGAAPALQALEVELARLEASYG